MSLFLPEQEIRVSFLAPRLIRHAATKASQISCDNECDGWVYAERLCVRQILVRNHISRLVNLGPRLDCHRGCHTVHTLRERTRWSKLSENPRYHSGNEHCAIQTHGDLYHFSFLSIAYVPSSGHRNVQISTSCLSILHSDGCLKIASF